MIATCTNRKCGLVFDSLGIDIKNSINVVIENNRVTCPKCSSVAKLLDGTFNFDKDGLATLLSGPQITFEILTQLKLLAEKAIKDEYSTETFKEKAKSISPILEFLNSFIPEDKKEFRNYFYTFLTGLILFLLSEANDSEQNIKNNIYNTYNIRNVENTKPFVQKGAKLNSKKRKGKRGK